MSGRITGASGPPDGAPGHFYAGWIRGSSGSLSAFLALKPQILATRLSPYWRSARGPTARLRYSRATQRAQILDVAPLGELYG